MDNKKNKCIKACKKESELLHKQMVSFYKTIYQDKELSKHIERSKKNIKKQEKHCNKIHCNVGCKKTIFESGTDITKAMKNKYKKDTNKLNMINNQRNSIFNNKTNVLKDNFYEKIPSKKINMYKKKGFISGCAINL